MKAVVSRPELHVARNSLGIWHGRKRERERERERDVEHAAGPILSEEGRTFGRWGHVPPPVLPGGRHAQWSRTSVKDGQMERERERERER